VDADTLRPILSGAIGAVISGWFLTRLTKWVPVASRGKPAETLLAENRTRIYAANTLFFLGIVSAIFMYQKGYFPRNDWRPAALGFGFGCVAPVLFLYLSTLNAGASRTQEVFVAYSISQKTPPLLLYGILFLGFVAFFAAVASLAAA
jgi:hypothetical protein